VTELANRDRSRVVGRAEDWPADMILARQAAQCERGDERGSLRRTYASAGLELLRASLSESGQPAELGE
jgi:hypothetical protein